MAELRTTLACRSMSSLPSTARHSRAISFAGLGRTVAKRMKLPAYIGGGLAAAGSYVVYKVEEARDFATEKLEGVHRFGKEIKDGILGLFDGFGSGGEDGGAGPSGPQRDKNDGSDKTAVAATAAAAGVAASQIDDTDDEEDEREQEERDKQVDNQMMNLTKQMIEIRNILLNVDGSTNLNLPAIVVIGSQSSGKSSVLESIVGQEFLPKGNNMVTRRPIELTLVNDPNQAAEVAEFPALKMYNMTDFQQVQKILRDLNMAVPESEAVTADPIQLTIKSPTVPDLSLVDLPGYIQVEAADQPASLKEKIQSVCDRYLMEPNIILAISAADVDLANSSALRAAKKADPKGERTIGVITKLDLVSPQHGRELLTNKKYPLKIGYLGVITHAPNSTVSIFHRQTGTEAYRSQQSFERSYFKENRAAYQNCDVGTNVLKRRLMKVLESSMARALQPMRDNVAGELEETSYQFKVEFNDRELTSEKYMAQTVDNLKLVIKEFGERFGRPEIKSLLRSELDQRTLDLLADRYWNHPVFDKKATIEDPPLQELEQVRPNDSYWTRKLDLATASLTKLGVGRLSTTLISDALLTEIDSMLDQSELHTHPAMKDAIKEAAVSVLSRRYNSTADQVENCIKPYKYEIDVEPREWILNREHTGGLLKEELKQCNSAFQNIKKTVGGNKLKQIMMYLENEDNSVGETMKNENLGFSPTLVSKGRQALFLKQRASLLSMRLRFLRSSTCKHKENKSQCPEVFLNTVADKLTATAVLFLNVELLSDFYYSFPRELEDTLTNGLSKDQIDAYAKEDPKVKKHIELQERRDLLQLALSKIDDVMALRKLQ